MAQALFEALAAGVAGMDSQTALAVQSLLESQTVAEQPAQVEDEDVFQCGKCKKQFNSLSTFVSHKQNRCTPTVLHQGGAIGCMSRVVNQAPPGSDANGSFSASVTHILNKQSLTGYNPIPQSPLNQSLGQGMVLTDDLMPFAGLEQAISNSTMHVGASMQSNPFLSQVSSGGATCPMTTSTNFATIATQSFASGNSAFTSTIPMNPIQLQQVATPQSTLELQQVITQEGATSIGVGPPKMMTLPVVKPNATKIASPKMSVPNTSLITVITDLDTNTVTHQCHGGTKADGSLLLLESNVDGGGDTTVGVVSTTKKKLKCQYCDKLFTKNFDLQQHVRSHTGEKPFQCIVCGRAFAQKSNVKKHMQTHKVWPQGMAHTLPDQPSPELVVTTSQDTIEGVTEGVTEGVIQGTMPNQIQNVEVNLSNELTGVRSRVQMSISPENSSDPKSSSVKIVVDNTYICQYCAQKFKSYFQLKSHMVEHKSEQVYKCIMSSCCLTFTDLDGFLEHTKTHENEMNYRCHVCNKHFPSLYELGVHQYSHSLYPNQGPKPGPKHFRCVKCNNKYATPEALHHHMVTTTHKFSCPHCTKTFTCERYLRRHLPTHGTIGEYECNVCKKCFKTDHYLKMHMLIHSGEKPFLCDQCSAAFNRKDKLKRHMLIHEPNKKYKCPFRSHTGCTKAFNRPDKLKAHIITHSGIKPYQCRECGKSFSRRPHLVDHERLHRNDYRYSCQKCGKGFLRMQVFKRHRCRRDDEEGDEAAATTNDAASRMTKMRRRPTRRKVSQPPRKRLITVTEESIKAAAAAGPKLRRGRPRKAKNSSQDNNVIVIQPLSSAGGKIESTQGNAVVTTASSITVVSNTPRNITMDVNTDALLQEQQKANTGEEVTVNETEAATRLEPDQLAELATEGGDSYNGEMVDNVVCGMATLQSLSLVPTGDNSAKLVVGSMLTTDGGGVVSMSDSALGTMPSSVTYVSVPVTSMTDLGGGNMGTTYVTADTCNPTEHLASTGADHSAAYGSNARTVLSESAIATVTGHSDTEVTYVTADHNGVVHVANQSLLTHGQGTDTVAYLTATAADQNMAAMVSISDAGQVDAPVTYVTLEQLAYQTAGDAMLDGTDALLATSDDILKVANT